MQSYGLTQEQYLELEEFHHDTIVERKTCVYSWEQFPIYASELEMLQKLSPKLNWITFDLPSPVAAPYIRKLLRTTWKNERTLYYHTCDLTGKKSISRINPTLWIKIYTNEAWASDSWECTDYGTDRQEGTVSEKIKQLAYQTPYQDLIGSLTNTQTNALYTNYTADITDSYLVFDAHTIQNCYYVTKARRCTDCVDGVQINDCNRCVWCYDCKWCHGCVGLARCASCVSSRYLIDCVSCQDCIWCVWLEHKQCCVYNKQLSKEDYAIFKKSFIESWAKLDSLERNALINESSSFSSVVASENATGYSIRNCTNILRWEDMLWCQDMLWCNSMSEAQDCIDVSSYGHESSRMVHCSQVGRYSNSLLGCVSIGRSENLMYCIDVKKSRYCFGCVNMKWKEYCIFNTQYTKDQYFEIVPKLIAAMQADGSRGHFLNPETNVIIYNDSKVLEEFPVKCVINTEWNEVYSNADWYGTVTFGKPISSDIVHATLDLWWKQLIPILWRTAEIASAQSDSVIDADALQLSSKDITHDQLKRPIRCSHTWKLYRINKPELDIYQSLWCPLPRVHHDVRYDIIRNG